MKRFRCVAWLSPKCPTVALAAVSVSFAIATAVNLVQADDAKPVTINPLEIGDRAPEFDLPGVDGKTHSLEEYKDAQLLLVIFTCNHCPTAQAYEQRIKQLDSDYRDRGVKLVAISPNDPKAVRLDECGWTDVGDTLDDMKIRAKSAGFKFPYLFDGETQKVSRAYGAKVTPHVFLFDKDRRLRYSGRIDNSDVETVTKQDTRDAIEALLAGREVSKKTTRVFGCSVKWSDKRKNAEQSLKKWDALPVTLKTIDEAGLKKLVANDSDKYRLINLWATWCTPCMTELPHFVEISRRYQTRSFEVITISMDKPDRIDGALRALKQRKVATTNYLTTITDTDDFAEALDARWDGPMPYTILVAPGGKIVHRVEGEIDPLKLRQEIVRHLGRTYASKR
jgi:peroxiredoxin